MRKSYSFVLVIFGMVWLAACQPAASQQLPTLIPSATVVPPTDTPAATATDTPIPGPTATIPYAPQTTAADPSQQVYLRVVNAAPSAPTVDVYVELRAIATNLDFARNTEPSGIVAGEYVLRVVLSGAGLTAPPLLEQVISLPGGQSLLLVLTDGAEGLALSTFPESNTPLTRGESGLTIINAVPGSTAISVREGSADLTAPLDFGQVSPPITLTSGRTTLTIGGAESYPLDLREQFNHTLVLVGPVNDVTVVSFESRAPSRSQIRALNASAPIGPVDVYLNDQLIAADAAFGRPSEIQNIIAQTYNVNVYAAGADRTAIEPLLSAQTVANANDVITLILLGPPDNLRLLEYRQDLSPTPLEETRIAFLNTLYNLPSVELTTPQGTVGGIDSLMYAQSPDEIPLLAASYTFFWTNPNGDLVEVAENVQLEAGRTYLYLFTGRLDSPPLIVSTNVGIDEELPTTVITSGEAPTDTPNIPTQIRVVNAIGGGDMLVDFAVDGAIVAAGLNYRQGSDLITVERGDHNFTINPPESADILASADNFLDSSRYSIFAYRVGTDSTALLVTPDYPLIFDGQSPHLRLVNVTFSTDVRLGLAYSLPVAAVDNPQRVSTLSDDVRRSIPFGLQRLLTDIPGQNFSGVVLMPVGSFDVYILDTTQNAIAATIPNVVLEAGAHYDVVAYQEVNSQRVHAFMLEYPTRSA